MIKTQKTRISTLLLVLITLFSALFIPINAAEPETSEDKGIEEIMPTVANLCIYNNLPTLFIEVGRWYNFDFEGNSHPYTLTNGYTYSMAPAGSHDYQCVTIWDKNGNEVDLFYDSGCSIKVFSDYGNTFCHLYKKIKQVRVGIYG